MRQTINIPNVLDNLLEGQAITSWDYLTCRISCSSGTKNLGWMALGTSWLILSGVFNIAGNLFFKEIANQGSELIPFFPDSWCELLAPYSNLILSAFFTFYSTLYHGYEWEKSIRSYQISKVLNLKINKKHIILRELANYTCSIFSAASFLSMALGAEYNWHYNICTLAAYSFLSYFAAESFTNYFIKIYRECKKKEAAPYENLLNTKDAITILKEIREELLNSAVAIGNNEATVDDLKAYVHVRIKENHAELQESKQPKEEKSTSSSCNLISCLASTATFGLHFLMQFMLLCTSLGSFDNRVQDNEIVISADFTLASSYFASFIFGILSIFIAYDTTEKFIKFLKSSCNANKKESLLDTKENNTEQQENQNTIKPSNAWNLMYVFYAATYTFAWFSASYSLSQNAGIGGKFGTLLNLLLFRIATSAGTAVFSGYGLAECADKIPKIANLRSLPENNQKIVKALNRLVGFLTFMDRNSDQSIDISLEEMIELPVDHAEDIKAANGKDVALTVFSEGSATYIPAPGY